MSTIAVDRPSAHRAHPSPAATRAPAALLLLVALTAGLVYLQFGLQGRLSRDDAVLVYAGQQLAQGVLPYRSVVTLKGPLAQAFAAVGVVGARATGTDEVLAVRLLFMAVSVAIVALIAFIGTGLWCSRRTGLFSALVFLGFAAFARHAASGPSYHTVMVLFTVLCLLLTARRQWMAAGAGAALAYLSWQPSGVFLATVVLLALAQPAEQRWRAAAGAATGIVLPLALVTGVFIAAGLFQDLALRVFLCDLPYIHRPPSTMSAHLLTPLKVTERGYGVWAAVPLILGLAGLCHVAIERRRQLGAWTDVLLRDRFSVVLMSLPPLLAWMLVDFQNPPDLFIVLPHIALGAGAMLDEALRRLERWRGAATMRGHFGTAGTILAALVLLVVAVRNVNADRDAMLPRQREAASEIVRRYGATHTFVSIEQPELLVLAKRTNPNPYLFIEAGTDVLIDTHTPGGFAGWLASLDRLGPTVVSGGVMQGQHEPELRRWLAASRHVERIGMFRIYVRQGRGR